MAPKKRSRAAAIGNKQSKASSDTDVGDGGLKRKREASAIKSESQKNRSSASEKAPYTHWLMKSEPESRIENGVDVKFGIEDLKALPNQTGCWDGVRNYQARNFMRDMKVAQRAFFYHSNCKEPGIAGIIKVVKEAYVDHTQFDKKDVHYDPSSKPETPKWSMLVMLPEKPQIPPEDFVVDVQFERMTKRFISLTELKKYHLKHKGSGGALSNMALFTRARLSVQPLTAEEFDFVLSLEDTDPL